jgi:acetyl-CoA/propionyl-CoA carboxylase biotin carboxyl carrier protein
VTEEDGRVNGSESSTSPDMVAAIPATPATPATAIPATTTATASPPTSPASPAVLPGAVVADAVVPGAVVPEAVVPAGAVGEWESRDVGPGGLGFSSVLVANRGEIAVRIIRTLRELGLRSIAVYTDADAGARHVREADLAVRLAPSAVRDSYLDVDAVLDAARLAGAQAVHPGYGFLAGSGALARACVAAGLRFVGPSAAALELMGDKIRARRTVAEVGVPVVPGRSTPGMSDAAIIEAAAALGYPVMVKPAAGAGGRGMRVVREPGRMAAALASARFESAVAFDDATLYVERLISRPRHVEVQVLADEHGTVLHLGERECSLQRDHQTIVAETPSPLLDARTRERLGAAAVEVASAVGYVGAGTVEFIMSADAPDEFYFMEMGTRLQVEHAVTELVTGVDLVAEQIRIAAGEPLRFGQADVTLSGHAMEARVRAEDPGRDFAPTSGEILALREPSGPALRVDSGVDTGDTVGSVGPAGSPGPGGPAHDPMIAKVVSWGPDRPSALARLDAALADTVLLGVPTNIGFLRALLALPDVRSGRLDTGLVGRHLAALTADEPPAEALLGYALAGLLALQPAGPLIDPWDVPSGWRPGEPAWLTWEVTLPSAARPASGHTDGQAALNGATGDAAGGAHRPAGRAPAVRVSARGTPDAARVRLGDGRPVAAAVRIVGDELLVTAGAVTTRWAFAWADGAGGSSTGGTPLWLGRDGRAWLFAEATPESTTTAASDVPDPPPPGVTA